MVDTGTGTETVVAGTGAPGSFGDEGPATSAMLDDPRGLSLDAAGDLFIADRVNNRIRKVTPDGKIHTVAGNGIASYSGNGRAATRASLSFPQAVFSDPASGNLYVADTAIARDGAGNLFIGEPPHQRVLEVDSSGAMSIYAGTYINGPGEPYGDGGPAIYAILGWVSGLAEQKGNLLIADGLRHVRQVLPTGNHVISTVAGTGNTCGDADDGSPATSAQLCPNTESGSLALDAQGRLLISDRGQAVRRVKPDGTMGTLIA